LPEALCGSPSHFDLVRTEGLSAVEAVWRACVIALDLAGCGIDAAAGFGHPPAPQGAEPDVVVADGHVNVGR